jgi:hypothetical protein
MHHCCAASGPPRPRNPPGKVFSSHPSSGHAPELRLCEVNTGAYRGVVEVALYTMAITCVRAWYARSPATENFWRPPPLGDGEAFPSPDLSAMAVVDTPFTAFIERHWCAVGLSCRLNTPLGFFSPFAAWGGTGRRTATRMSCVRPTARMAVTSQGVAGQQGWAAPHDTCAQPCASRATHTWRQPPPAAITRARIKSKPAAAHSAARHSEEGHHHPGGEHAAPAALTTQACTASLDRPVINVHPCWLQPSPRSPRAIRLSCQRVPNLAVCDVMCWQLKRALWPVNVRRHPGRKECVLYTAQLLLLLRTTSH